MKDHELKKLLNDIRAGSSAAFDRFYQEFGRQVVPFLIGKRLVDNLQDAEDLAQDTLLKIWRILHTGDKRFEIVAALRKYVMTTAQNAAIDRKRRPISTSGLDSPLDDEERGKGPQQTLEVVDRIHEGIEAGSTIRAALKNLTNKQRRAILFYERDSLSYDEIAQIEKCTKGAVRSRLAEAREKIANWLAQQHDVSER
jgi:RNA polymerase sigma-70 factor, ECF subfamily